MSIEIRTDSVGLVFRILVTEGQDVAEGEHIILLEAMKMEFPVPSPSAGTVTSIAVAEGDSVNAGDLLLTLD